MAEVISIEREPLVRAKAVADYLCIDEVTVRKWASAKVNPIPCRRFGRRGFIRFRMSEVVSWAEKEMAS